MHIGYKIILILTVMLFLLADIAFASENGDITDALEQQFDQYDFSDIDAFTMDSANTDFSSIVKSILDGTFNSEETIWNNILKLVLPGIKKVLQNMPILFALVLFISIINNLLPESSRFHGLIQSISGCFVYTLIFICFITVFNQARQAVNTITEALNRVVPILSVALVASGASSTANTLNPESAIISQAGANVINNLFLPIILILAIILALDVIFVQNRFTNLFNFGKNIVTWGAGGLFTVYAAIVSINGFASTSYDGISLRTVRYAMSNSIPLIGSLLGDGVNMAIACCSIVKSAIGIASFLVIMLTAIAPIISMAVYMFMLKIVATCISPFAPANTIRMVSTMADLIKLLISVLAGLTIIILIIIGFVIGAAGNF